jgi:hypothetical protein
MTTTTKKSKNTPQTPQHPLDLVIEKIRAMTTKERHEVYMRLGIVDEKWDLTTEYGGTAKPSPKRVKFPNER